MIFLLIPWLPGHLILCHSHKGGGGGGGRGSCDT